jgi:hypothetical protein
VNKKRVAETFPALLLIRQFFSRARHGHHVDQGGKLLSEIAKLFDLAVRGLRYRHPALKSSSTAGITTLFEQLLQILKHGLFFVRARAIGDKELLAQVQCLSLHCGGTKPISYRSQESISVP